MDARTAPNEKIAKRAKPRGRALPLNKNIARKSEAGTKRKNTVDEFAGTAFAISVLAGLDLPGKVKRRYSRCDLIKPVDPDRTNKMLRDGFDAWGQPKEFEQQAPTLEWREKAGEFHEEPEISQSATRLHHRKVPVFVRMAASNLIDTDEAEAGMKWLKALEFLEGSPTPCSYGQVRGGKSGDDPADIAADASLIDRSARAAIGDFRVYRWLKLVALNNATADKAPPAPRIAHRGGVIPPATRRRHYTQTIQVAVARLAKVI